jgi:hypothetical protein
MTPKQNPAAQKKLTQRRKGWKGQSCFFVPLASLHKIVCQKAVLRGAA